MEMCADFSVRYWIGVAAIVAMLAWFCAPLWLDTFADGVRRARVFLQRAAIDRNYPPALTNDLCAGCGHALHNRDSVLNLSGRFIHARVGCSLAAREPGVVYRAVGAAQPYLVAKGVVRTAP